MPSIQAGYAPDFKSFRRYLKDDPPLESSIEFLIALLKRRQIKNSRACAIATAELLRHVVAESPWTDIGKLIVHIKEVGQRLVNAQPRELAIGNIVRRVVGMIRDEAIEDRMENDSNITSVANSPKRQSSQIETPTTPSSLRFSSLDLSNSPSIDGVDGFSPRVTPMSRPPLMTSHTSYAVAAGAQVQHSMFNLLSSNPSPFSTPSSSQYENQSPLPPTLAERMSNSVQDLQAEVVNGIEEILDELEQVDDQIASYAPEHIHSNEIILTYSPSVCVYKFLLRAAEKRKFTLIVAESYPNEHEEIHKAVMGKMKDPEQEDEQREYLKSLEAAGVTVILVTDAAIFAVMSRVNKVILPTHAVVASGGLIAVSGTKTIAKAARVHRTPIIVVSGVYKLCPEYPFEFESLIEYGDPGSIVKFHDGPGMDSLEVDNPEYDYVPPDLVDLYITNLGAHPPSYLYRIIADHYKIEDINYLQNL